MSAHAYLPPTPAEVVFLLLGLVAVAAGLLVVTTRNLVHAALWLVVSLGALAGCFLVLTAEFVAWVQVLIYVGAVVVLLLFGLMLTRAPVGRSDDLTSGNKYAAAAVAVATAALLVTVVVGAFDGAYADLDATQGTARANGTAIFRYWVLPFEVLSVLLLAALVGAIVLSRRDIGRRTGGPAEVGAATTRAGTGDGAHPGARPGARPGADPRAHLGARPGADPGARPGARIGAGR